MSKTHSVLEPMDIVVIYAGKPKERRFRVFPKMADDLAALLDERKRFQEWEDNLKVKGTFCGRYIAKWELEEKLAVLLELQNKIEKELP